MLDFFIRTQLKLEILTMNKQPLKSAGGVQVDIHDEAANILIDLVETLLKIDTTKPIAKLNATSITDNNGKRINL